MTASKVFFYIGLRCYNCLINLYADILQAALLVWTSNHNYLIFPSFSLSLFTVIKDQTLAMQFPWCWLQSYAWLCFFHSVGCKFECHLRLMAYLLIPLSIWRYTRKRWGPRTNPFGTPVDSGTCEEILLLIFTAWVRPVRCDCTMRVLFYVSPTSFGSLSYKKRMI